jgi:hypothetical protein
MATGYTSLLGLALPATGELSGTWGDTVNSSITTLLDDAVASTTTLSADADVTLSSANGVTNEARKAILLWTANGTVTRNITAPARSKAYVVLNNSAGTQSIVLRGAGPTTGVTILKDEAALCVWNGSDFVKVSSNSVSSVIGTLSPTRGGTGVSNNVLATVTSAGNFAYTRTLTANTNVTFPTTGTLATVGGTETLTNKTLTTPTISSIVNTGTLTLPTATDTLVGRGTTDTLTNKRIDPRDVVAATATTLTPDLSVGDIYAYTALATSLTINTPIGSPANGEILLFRFFDNGTARSLLWNGPFTAIAVTLPTVTVPTKTTYVGCIYNSSSSPASWDVIAVSTQT